MSTDLEQLLRDAVRTQPPSQVDLDAAVRRGRTLRARRLASRTVTGLAAGVVAVALGALVLVGLPGGAATSPAGPSTPSGTVASTGTGAPEPVVRSEPQASAPALTTAQLKQVARRIVDHSGVGTVERVRAVGGDSVIASVTTPGGRYELSVAAPGTSFGSPADWTAGCSPSVADDKPCVIAASSAHDVLSTVTWQGSFAGRSGALYVADIQGRGTLLVNVTNYVEQPDGAKVLGPTVAEAGIDIVALRAATAPVTGS